MLVFNITKNKKYILGILVLAIILVIVGIILSDEPVQEGTYFSDNFYPYNCPLEMVDR